MGKSSPAFEELDTDCPLGVRGDLGFPALTERDMRELEANKQETAECEVVESANLGSVDVTRVSKKGWMDTAALMLCAEMSMEEIAAEVGKPLQVILQLPGMPEFRDKVRALTKNNESQVVEKLVRGSLVDSVLTIIRIRDDREVGAKLQLQASLALLDRGLGKCVEATKVHTKPSVAQDLADKVAQGGSAADIIDNEITALLEQNPGLKNRIRRTNTSTM